MKTLLRIAPFILVALGIGLIALGIAREEFLDVLNKASIVCFECIGIG